MKTPDSFDTARLNAILQYNMLETSLAMLLQQLLATTQERANLIFFRIVNTRARYGIISDLLRVEHKDRYKRFWAKLEKLLGSADTARNHIIHWMPTITVDDDGEHPRKLLNPVTYFRAMEGEPSYDEENLKEFASTYHQLSWVVMNFFSYLQAGDASGVPQALIDIFHEPPLNQNLEEFRQELFGAAQLTPPQSSEG